ncbi:hypothetical protein Tco_1150220, partial [Tanacetum coccineum]
IVQGNPKELGIRSSLLVPGQVMSPTSGQKRKHQELEPKTCIPRLECNRSLSEGVPFVNNLVDVDTLLTYVVMASNVNTSTNQRFCMVLRSLIDSHLDKEKLKSKKVKLEAVGYSLNWSLSELPSRVQPEFTRKTQPFSEAVLCE